MKYITRHFSPSEQSYFLFGPRGTGKSTFLKHHYQNALWIDLLMADVYRTLSAFPERLKERVEGNPDKDIIIIDEIQKIPDLLGVVHALVEQHNDKQFILTGSSARKLKRSGVNLLAGRLHYYTMHPFMLSEDVDSSFDEALDRGLVPVVAKNADPRATLDAYVSLYVQEEVQQEGLVRNIGAFHRFLESISFSHGAQLNISNVAREAQIERKVVEGYIHILQDILLAYRIPVFTKKAKRAVVSHPKLFLYDCGVFRTLRPRGPLDRPEEISGAALEGLVAQHLKAFLAYGAEKNDLFYWRTQRGVEVDFILYGESGITAIEVKNAKQVRHQDLKGLKAFRTDYPRAQCILLYRGDEKLLISDVHCLPVAAFLRKLSPGKSIDEAF
ncbi:MAG: AAA family ATPase [candidate division KSB1 bacterium]|nr:AAA family ATPase [candidate division KSB1 bacterium]